ncbi:MAG: polysaccharide biosynthesis C-terminal domain-containing protein [Acidobacteria bacterium]|nr:polysaccharide biosynthesis C-terminal domain-containing protein [Acidobacteriota bacterium]
MLLQVGSAFFSFGTVWLISKRIGSEGYGGLVAILAASQVAQILVNWTSFAVARFGTEEFIETEKIARAFWLRLFVLVPNFLLVLAASRFWFPPLAAWLKLPPEYFWFVILHFVLAAFWIHVQFGLQAAKLPRKQGFLLTVERLLILLGVGVLILLGKLSPLAALVCYLIAAASVIAAGLFQLRHYLFARFTVDWDFTRRILAYSVPLLPFSLIGYFSGGYVDAVFVSKFLSTRDLGVYSIATQISGIALQLPTLANTLLLPMFVSLQKESGHERLSNYFGSVLPGLTLLWGIGCAVLSFAGAVAIPLVFGAEFEAATLPLWILLAASIFAIPVMLGYASLSNATSATWVAMFSAIFSAAANIGANFLLIPKYGMAGCAWATLIAYFVSVTTFALLLRRSAKIPLGWTFPAALPSLAAAAFFTFRQTPWAALLICLIASFLVGYFFKTSLLKTISFLRNYRGKADSLG